MAKCKVSYDVGLEYAIRLKNYLGPVCERIEIAGSLRRKVTVIGDIEILCIPKRDRDLFGNLVGISWLDPVLSQMVEDGRLLAGDKNGNKYKTFYAGSYPDLQIDLFITDLERWPVRYAIVTGDKNFSRSLVTPKNKGGLLPSQYTMRDNFIWEGMTKVPLETEREFLELCGGWVDPWDRHIK